MHEESPRKIRIVLLFGGRSAEHEVSLQSARNILAALDPQKYEVLPVGIDRSGTWHLGRSGVGLLTATAPGLARLSGEMTEIVRLRAGSNELVAEGGGPNLGAIDVVFPVLHGPMGEDGTIQGLLKLAGIPFVGPDVLGSAVGMDKDVSKRLLRDAGISVARFITVMRHRIGKIDADEIISHLGLPLFVKPANMGSSVGVERVDQVQDLLPALERAAAYDTKVLIEEFVGGREIECAVLGNEEPEASIPGEVLTSGGHGFYSYAAKYLDEHGATIAIPAALTEAQVEEIRKTAIRAFQTLCCEGMARVDFFLTPDNRIVVNEINTIPGFTSISMFPKLWEASGLPYPALIDRLVTLAMERGARDARLKVTPDASV